MPYMHDLGMNWIDAKLSDPKHSVLRVRGRKSPTFSAVPKSARSGQPCSGNAGSSFQRMLAGFTSPGAEEIHPATF
eukprot:15442804-Alexandrium_andersonii.AAC.1